MTLKRILQGMQSSVSIGDAFNRENFATIRLHCEHQAGARAAPINQHSASAAHAVFASDMRARETQFMPQKIRQQHAYGRGAAMLDTVHLDRNGAHIDGFVHGRLPWAREAAVSKARATSVRQRCFR